MVLNDQKPIRRESSKTRQRAKHASIIWGWTGFLYSTLKMENNMTILDIKSYKMALESTKISFYGIQTRVKGLDA